MRAKRSDSDSELAITTCGKIPIKENSQDQDQKQQGLFKYVLSRKLTSKLFY